MKLQRKSSRSPAVLAPINNLSSCTIWSMAATARVLSMLTVVGIALLGCSVAPPPDLGVSDGRLAPCPDRPNCVSSQSADPRHAIEPFRIRKSPKAAMIDLRTVIEGMEGARVVAVFEKYLHAEFRSALLRFVDDVEFVVDEARGVIHVRSASRLGYSDFGVNRKRLESIRLAFEKR